MLCLTWLIVPDKRFEVWMQKDHCKDGKHSSWVKECSIDISTLRTARGVYPLAIEGDGRIVLWLGKFLYYDPKSKSFEEINVGKTTFRASFYVKSFISLNR